jgi:hypothetical protein
MLARRGESLQLSPAAFRYIWPARGAKSALRILRAGQRCPGQQAMGQAWTIEFVYLLEYHGKYGTVELKQ